MTTVADQVLAPAVPGLALDYLRRLADRGPDVARWRHWVLGLDIKGRITLPLDARAVRGRSATVRVASRDHALVLQRDGLGVPTPVDDRGRLIVPVWLRRRVELTGTVLLAARHPDASVVVLTSTSVLDTLVADIAQEVS